MDKDDIQSAMAMYYEEMGWDKANGSPTAEVYKRLGLAKVAYDLGKIGLLP